MNDIQTNWDWSSHKPVLRYLVNEHELVAVVEHGSGMHSTPILKEGALNYFGYEENKEFRYKMILSNFYANHDVHNLDLPEGTELFTQFSALTAENKVVLYDIYAKLYKSLAPKLNSLKGLKMLFIDGYSCSRTMCLNVLGELFDIIVIHDTEDGSYDYYEYNFKTDEPFVDMKRLTITTPVPYTTILYRDNVEIHIPALRMYLDEYCDELEMERNQMDIV